MYAKGLAPYDRDKIVTLWKLLKQYSEVTTLDLSHCGIDDKMCRVLAKNTTLINLNLSHNLITNRGAFYLSKNKTIRYLNVSGNQIGFIGIHCLKATKLEDVIRFIAVKDNPGYEKWKVFKSSL